MTCVSDVIRGWLGWCPNAHTMKVPVSGSRSGTEPSEISKPESPQPGTSPAIITVHHGMIAVALVILLATCFVGGNIWWPALVFVILVICIIIHIRTLNARGGAR